MNMIEKLGDKLYREQNMRERARKLKGELETMTEQEFKQWCKSYETREEALAFLISQIGH
jgi:hypothetical protein